MSIRRLTKRALIPTAIRLSAADRDRVFAGAKLEGISQSEFLRLALRERAERVLTATVAGRGEAAAAVRQFEGAR